MVVPVGLRPDRREEDRRDDERRREQARLRDEAIEAEVERELRLREEAEAVAGREGSDR